MAEITLVIPKEFIIKEELMDVEEQLISLSQSTSKMVIKEELEDGLEHSLTKFENDKESKEIMPKLEDNAVKKGNASEPGKIVEKDKTAVESDAESDEEEENSTKKTTPDSKNKNAELMVDSDESRDRSPATKRKASKKNTTKSVNEARVSRRSKRIALSKPKGPSPMSSTSVSEASKDLKRKTSEKIAAESPKRARKDRKDEKDDEKDKKTKNRQVLTPELKKQRAHWSKYLTAAGIKVRNYQTLWADCESDEQRIDRIKELLVKNGVKDKPTLEKYKKVKAERDRSREIANLDEKNIISDERATRSKTSKIPSPNHQKIPSPSQVRAIVLLHRQKKSSL